MQSVRFTRGAHDEGHARQGDGEAVGFEHDHGVLGRLFEHHGRQRNAQGQIQQAHHLINA